MKYWNLKIKGLLGCFIQMFISVASSFLDKISSFSNGQNLGYKGANIRIQNGFTIRYPGNIKVLDNVKIGRNVSFTTEFNSSLLYIGKNTQINKNTCIDYSGGVHIGSDCVISEDVLIETHSHGHNPKSDPIPIPLNIGDNVWIGARALILPQVTKIGSNSIIAAGSIVTKPVDEYVLVGGNPARVLKKLN